MEPIFNEEQENYIMDVVESFSTPSSKITKTDAKYNEDVKKVISLLSACVVTPDGEGKATVNYLISDIDNRIELENYAMNLTRKNLNKKILVSQTGF